MNKLLPLALLSLSFLAHAQEGPMPTQLLVTVESKDAPPLTADNLVLEINKQKAPPTSLAALTPQSTQIALLIDDGLRTSVGRELSSLKSFITGLPAGTEVMVGYMSNGRVTAASGFTSDHEAAASQLRLPIGLPGISASPYFCLSDFVKSWPREGVSQSPARKARFVMMITNGVDPYNGSTSPLNQNSPYVDTAIRDAQRVGVSVSAIYFQDAGFRGNRGNFSGQSYLAQLADGTGGRSYWQGNGNPVSTEPYLEQFSKDISETYVATFPAVGKDLIDVRIKTTVPKLKVRAARLVRAGNIEVGR
jgi:hypothetical protein